MDARTNSETDRNIFQLSDWDRFAADEYEQLVAEEGNTELMEDMCYDGEDNAQEENVSNGNQEKVN